MSLHGSYKAHCLFIENIMRGGERSVVKGKEEVSWFNSQLDEHASSTMPTDVAAGLSVLKLLLDFRELPVCVKDSNGRNPKARPQHLSYFSRPCNNILRPQKTKKGRKYLSENRKAIGGSHRTRVLQAFRVTSKLSSDQGRRDWELFRHSRKLTRSLFFCAAQWMRNGR